MMQSRSEFASTTGNFTKETGVEEKQVKVALPTERRSMDPKKGKRLGMWKRQSPQIGFAWQSQASSRSATGTRAVENIADIGGNFPIRQQSCPRIAAGPMSSATLAQVQNPVQVQNRRV